MWKIALTSIALIGFMAAPVSAGMVSSSFASRGVSVGPRTSVGTLKSFNAGRGLTGGQTQQHNSQGTAFKRYKLENAWPSNGGHTGGSYGRGAWELSNGL
jgi:hypothetical protein